MKIARPTPFVALALLAGASLAGAIDASSRAIHDDRQMRLLAGDTAPRRAALQAACATVVGFAVANCRAAEVARVATMRADALAGGN